MTTELSARHKDEFSKATLGFWIYLMTDSVLFASLFATYTVLRGGTAGSVSGADIFDLNFVFIETVLLLLSSLTSGLALIGLRLRSAKLISLMLGFTFILGAAFLAMEIFEFTTLAQEGYGWTTSAFLSAFFSLVGTHGIHIAVGLIWLCGLLLQLRNRGLTNSLHKRLTLFSLYWHFLDIIWIFIFTLVYLIGVIS